MSSRIIFVHLYFYPDESAASQLLSDLAFHLAKQGFDVHVIASRQLYNHPSSDLPERETIQGVQVHRVNSTRFGRVHLFGRMTDYVFFYLRAMLALWRVTRKNDVVVCKTAPPFIGVFAYIVARLRRAKCVHWLQDLYPEIAQHLNVKGFNRFTVPLLKAIRNVTLRNADANVVISDRMSAYMQAQGVAIEKIRFIPNWADGARLSVLPHGQNELRKAWGLVDKWVFGYSGNLGRVHDFDTILQCAQLLREQTQIQFVIIGDGPRRQYIERYIASHGLSNVMLKPYQHQARLNEVLNVADTHFITLQANLEGFLFPSKSYSALATGRAIIGLCDREGELGQLILSHGCGQVANLGDATGLAEIIKRWDFRANQVNGYGAKARRLYDQSLNQKASLTQWRQLAQSLADP